MTFGLKISLLVPRYLLVLFECVWKTFKKSVSFLMQMVLKKLVPAAQKLLLVIFSLMINKLPHSWLHLIFFLNCVPLLLLIILPENLSCDRNWVFLFICVLKLLNLSFEDSGKEIASGKNLKWWKSIFTKSALDNPLDYIFKAAQGVVWGGDERRRRRHGVL